MIWSEQIWREINNMTPRGKFDKNYWSDLCEFCGIGFICLLVAAIICYVAFGA